MKSCVGFGFFKAPLWLAAGSIAVFVLLAGTGWSQSSMSPGGAATAAPVAGAGPLDGRRFRAGIVRNEADADEKKRPLEDQLVFKDGKFSSVVCKRYNFPEAPYWIRVEGDQVHFLAELTSPTDGTMVWTGTIRGDTLEGTMRWTKKRWYWTINTQHRIRGKLETGVSAILPKPN